MAWWPTRMAVKDTIETMKWTNELFHKFRKYQQISQELENLLQINIFSVLSEKFWTFREILAKIHQNFAEKWQKKRKIREFFRKNAKKKRSFLLEFWGVSGAKAKKSCRARKMLKNEPTLAIVAVDTGENEPLKVWGVSFHYFNRILNAAFCQRRLLSAGPRFRREHRIPAGTTAVFGAPYYGQKLRGPQKDP